MVVGSTRRRTGYGPWWGAMIVTTAYLWGSCGCAEVDPSVLADVKGRVAWPQGWEDRKHEAHLRLRDLSGSARIGWFRSDDTFAFEGVPLGRHVLEVYASDLVFPVVLVDVYDPASVSYTLRDRDAPSQFGRTTLGPTGPMAYYETTTSWLSVQTWRRHPWMIGIGLLVVSLLVLPKILDAIDPEGYQAVRQQMGQS